MADADFSVKAIISAQTSQFEKGMKNAQSSVNSLSNSLTNITNLVKKAFAFTGVVVGTKALVDFGKTAVKSGNQANKTLMILDNTVKATGADAWTTTQELEAMAKSLSDQTDYSVTELEKMQSVLLGFREITGENFEEASEAILDMATVMGMDLTSAVQTVGKALDDPIKGLDSLRRQGFAFTNEQKAELAQLVKNGKKLEAQKIILDELARSYGGASKAGQDSFAKQTHAMENFRDALGTKLLPLVKSFAEDNAAALNSLTKLIEGVDFNKIGAVIKVSFNTLKDLTKELVNNFRAIGDTFKNTFTGVNFKPAISTLNALLEIITKIGGSVGSRFEVVADSMEKLKDSLANMTANINFSKLEEAINIAISAVVFLYNEVSKVFSTLQENVKTFALNFWNSLKSVFEATNNSLADSESAFKSWGDYLYYTLNNLFKTVQDVVQSIAYLLDGDWQKAWEFAKLAVLRIVDEILASFDVMNTALGKKLTDMLDTVKIVAGVFGTTGKAIKTAITGIEKLMGKAGEGREDVQKLITETEQKITNLTGSEPDKNLKDLNRFVTGSSDLLGKFADNFKEATDKAKKELDDLSGDFKVTPSPSQVKDDLNETFKIVTEWDAKLLQQRLEYLEEHGKDYTEEYHQIQMALIKVEKQRAEQADSTGAETEKINEYYNKEMEEEDKRFEKAKRKRVLDTVKMTISSLKSVAKTAIDVFKKVASTIQNVFTNAAKIINDTFSKLVGLFSKLFEFNPDEALTNLLKIEDAILTFFVETLPQLPAFFESAFQSVLTLVQTLMNTIDWEGVKNILNSIIQTFTNYAPEILSGIVELFTGIVEAVSSVLAENAPEIVSAIGQMFFTILEALPSLISNFLNVAGTYLSEIGKYITDNSKKLSTDLTNIVESIVSGISNFIESGGWKNILSALLSIQNAIQNAVTNNLNEIVNSIIEALPDLVDMLIKSIVSASKAMEKVIKPIIRLVLALIEAIFEVLLSDEVLDAGIEAGLALIEAINEELLPKIAYLIPKLIVKIIGFIVKNLPKLVAGIIQGLVKAFFTVNWFEVIKEIFMGFIDGFKELFGIHSPSTVFEGFGLNIIEGLINGLKGISDSVMIILQPLFDLISGILDGILDGVIDMGGKALDFISDISEISFDALLNALTSTLSFLTDITKLTFDSVINLSKVSFDALNVSLNTILSSLNDITKTSFSGVNTGLKNIFNFLAEISKVSFDGLNKGLDVMFSGLAKITDSVTGLVKALTELVKVLGEISGFGGKGGPLEMLGFGGGNLNLDPMGNISKIVDTWKDEDKSVGEKVGETALKLVDPTGIVDTWKDEDKSVGEKVGETVRKVLDPFNITGKLSKVFGWATGTNSAPSGLALVGEAGPELVKFRGGEQVLNSHNTQKALEGMGGTTINQNVTFNNLQDTTAFAMLQQLKQYNRQMAINGIL